MRSPPAGRGPTRIWVRPTRISLLRRFFQPFKAWFKTMLAAPSCPGCTASARAGPRRSASVARRCRRCDPLSCSGASVGLPGGTEVFAADNIERILQGEVRIASLSDDVLDAFLSKNVVRHKDARTGQGTFEEPSEAR